MTDALKDIIFAGALVSIFWLWIVVAAMIERILNSPLNRKRLNRYLERQRNRFDA